MTNEKRICIVGAGVIGSYCALQLLRARPNIEIKIIDCDPFGYHGASSGNSGGFAVPEVMPRTTLSNLLKVPFWIMSKEAALSIRISYLPKLFPWIWYFVKSSITPSHFDYAVQNQQQLMKHAYKEQLEALQPLGLHSLNKEMGAIFIYKTKKSMEKDWQTKMRLVREQGYEMRRLSPADLKQFLPELDPQIRFGVYIPSISYWADPAALLRGLHKHLLESGIEIISGDVCGFSRNKRRVNGVVTRTGKTLQCDEVVIAAGAWSKKLCLQLGDYVPLDTERGYHTTLENPGIQVNQLLIFNDDNFVATPMDIGLRLAGTVELAGLESKPDYRRTDLLAKKIKYYFPSVNTSKRNEWLGFRPSVPDYLPVIGESPHNDNVFYAFGHNHVGMTQAAVTGTLIQQLITGEKPLVDLLPYSISRFC